MAKKLYLVIDVQKDFINGSLGSGWAQKVTPDIAKFLNHVKVDKNAMIWATRDTHFVSGSDNILYNDSLEGKKLPVLHCVKDTEGWQINSDIEKHVDRTFDKLTFMSERLGENIRQFQRLHSGDDLIDEIVLMGFCTSICVISNALYLRGLFPNLKITVLETLCADVSYEAHDAALTVMRNCQIDVETVMFALNKLSGEEEVGFLMQ